MPPKRKRGAAASKTKKKAKTVVHAVGQVVAAPVPKILETLSVNVVSRILKNCDIISATCVSITNKNLYKARSSRTMNLDLESKYQSPCPHQSQILLVENLTALDSKVEADA